ncbi:putative mRNA-decapping protein [Tetrabaena socialis]|uniref:Putative mRNA-decapping protein n=1 Tax=Tetrabaena socialis TaxID=47790 RepID=A0A2J7ZIW2_9CHLO|nr:putative mRNA-decapping protein [Tetrabaena socialis]|eukprot:PNH00203.1 putative mRNA-decapping protein [Tetrabaena socialis]
MKQDWAVHAPSPKPPILCANCGGIGHIYRVCNYPICSFGIICCRLTYDTALGALAPEYLMVQRKDSLCYVEFIRAKWSLQNRQYIMKLFTSMTPQERGRIARAADFDELWYGFWHNDTYRSYMREYQQARDQFNKLKQGFDMRCADTDEVITFSLDYILTNTSAEYNEAEWGWPKGRRNINESDIRCAMREFSEETGICARDISMLTNMKPFEEVFNGSNHVRYRHVYYLAVLSGNAKDKDKLEVVEQSMQAQEIGKVAWCNYGTVLLNIRNHNVERRELFKRVHQLVKNNLFNIMVIAGNNK